MSGAAAVPPLSQPPVLTETEGNGALQVPRVRLSARAASAARSATEQDVLHYQWFADQGNVDAQRAVGHILSAAGAQRDPAGALRYFQCALPSLLSASPSPTPPPPPLQWTPFPPASPDFDFCLLPLSATLVRSPPKGACAMSA